MKKILLKKQLAVMLLFLLSVILVSCEIKDKQTVLTENASEAVKNVDTSKAGTFTYDGVVEQYGRSVKFILNVLPIIKEKKIGYVKDVYQSNGKRYIKLDEVEFYMGNKAIEEGIKDKSENVYFADGKYHIYDDYYIRNKNPEIKIYEISEDATFNVCIYHYNLEGNSSITKSVSYSEFKKFSKETRLTWIYLEKNVVVKTEEQYTP